MKPDRYFLPAAGKANAWCAIGLAALLLMACYLPAWSAVRHVAPAHPHAADDGEGKAVRPYRSLAYAMSRVWPGDTLRIAAGTYREALVFPRRAWSIETPTTVTGEGMVTILGTDVVDGWKPVGEAGSGLFVRRGWQQEPQQVMVNGKQLKQVGGTIFNGYPDRPGHALAELHRSEGGIWPKRLAGGPAAMPRDSFFFDAQRRQILIRTNVPAVPGNVVEVAVRTYLVQGEDVAGVTIKGIRFRYSTTSTVSRQGAVTLMGHGNTLEDIIVEDADGAGIEVAGDGNRILRSAVTRSGYLGIKARGRDNLINANRITYNNTRGFNKWWEAGGMKFIGDGGLRQSRVEGNEVTHNYGDGIWFDWGNDDNRVEKNTVAYNQGFGIHYEASSRAHITDNKVFGNKQRGIYLPHSHNSVIAHNLVAANGLEGIVIIDEQRRDSDGRIDLRPRNNAVTANMVAWNKGLALILPGPQYGNVSDRNVYVQTNGMPQFSMDWPKGWTDKKNLAQWRSREAQDLSSTVIKAPMDGSIRDALARGEVKIDWAAFVPIKAIAVVSDALSDAATLPEEKSSDKVGPR
jgi:parallel beta-helix repeat protein